ncbi:MAG TPA: hypothetical protein VJU83_02425 [Burkholderiales bacterium]|nr:hypothetical protein [Burkholderiales bacterium]
MRRFFTLRRFFVWALLGYSIAALGQSEAAALKEALAALTAEQQTVYHQFQMLQSLREQAAVSSAMAPPPGPPGNYDDLVQQRQAALDQAKRYQSDMDVLYERYKRLEEEKLPLLTRLRELALQPPPEPPRPRGIAPPKNTAPSGAAGRYPAR